MCVCAKEVVWQLCAQHRQHPFGMPRPSSHSPSVDLGEVLLETGPCSSASSTPSLDASSTPAPTARASGHCPVATRQARSSNVLPSTAMLSRGC